MDVYDVFQDIHAAMLRQKLADKTRIDRAIQSSRRRAQGRSKHRADDFDEDLARIALVVRALADVCIQKGLVTMDELASQLAETDFADGVFDGRLDPKLVKPGESKFAKLEPMVEKPRAPQPGVPIVRKKKRT